MRFRPLLFVFAIFALSACNFAFTEDITPPPDYASPTPLPDIGILYPEKPPSPARGEGFFTGYCAPCHGKEGLGNGVMASQLPVAVPAIGLDEISRNVTSAEWYTIISRGNMERGMPSHYEFPTEERWDVLAYVFLLSSSPQELQHGKQLFETNCSECHGLSGSDNPKVDFTNQEYMSQVTNFSLYRSISEGKGDMKPFNGILSDDDIREVTSYIRSLSFDMSSLEPTPTSTTEFTETISPESTQMSDIASSETPTNTPVIDEVLETLFPVTAAVTGKVTNASGTSLDRDLIAKLIYYNTTEEDVFNTETTKIDSDGIFSFNQLFVDSETAYWVTVDYQGVTYYSKFVAFDGSTYIFDLPVVVYDATFTL
jgi:mono/diheme cytochrome c family protein